MPFPHKVITVAVDEKPGVQATANNAPDLPPVPGKHPTVSRDHEYKRLGALSILASLDLLAYSGPCRSPFRGEADHDSGMMAITIPG